MSDRLVVAFAGHPGSGKTAASEHAANNYGLDYYSPGELIRAEARAQGRRLDSRAAGMILLHEIEASRGSDFLANPILQGTGAMVVDGLRRMYELNLLRNAPDVRFRLVAIQTPIEDRHIWVVKNQNERSGRDSTDFETFQADTLAEARNSDPMEPSVVEVMEQADFTIYNSHGADLLTAVDEVIQRIKAENS